jgi:hypothetical protein
MKSTDIMISATISPPATLHAARHTLSGARRLLLNESMHLSAVDNLHIRAPLGSVHGSVQLSGWECVIERNRECTGERTVKQAGSVQLSAIGAILGSVLASVLGSVQPSRLGVCNRVQSGVYFRAYSQVNLASCNRAYLGACLGVCLEACLEACNEVHLESSVLYAISCISRADISLCIIVI